MHRTTIVILEELLRQLRRIAADQGRSMAAVVHEALEEKVRSYHPMTACWPASQTAWRALLPQSPRLFEKPTSVWTLELAADVAQEKGLRARRGSGEPMRRR